VDTNPGNAKFEKLKSNCWAGKLAGRLKVSNSDSNENESGLRSMRRNQMRMGMMM